MTAPEAKPRRPLAVTDDADLLDDILRLADVAGVELDVVPDGTAARRHYRVAPTVLIGPTAVASCVQAGLARRPGVVLVDRSDVAEPWPAAEAIGAERVALLPAAEPWLIDRLAHPPLASRPIGPVVAVLGARGGSGASVLAGGLAVTAARSGHRALLLDVDPLGGGADLLLGWEGVDGLRWPSFADATGSPPPSNGLISALPQQGDLAVLSWDRGLHRPVPVEAVATALDAGRSTCRLVAADLPRHLDEAAELVLACAELAILVVPAEVRATAAAIRMAAVASRHTDALAVVIRGPSPGGLQSDAIVDGLGLPMLGTFRTEPELARRLEEGQAPGWSGQGPLAGLCRQILDDLGLSTTSQPGSA